MENCGLIDEGFTGAPPGTVEMMSQELLPTSNLNVELDTGEIAVPGVSTTSSPLTPAMELATDPSTVSKVMMQLPNSNIPLLTISESYFSIM